MHQSIKVITKNRARFFFLMTVLGSPLCFAATESPKKVVEIFSQFQKQKADFLNLKIDKKTASKKVTEAYSELSASLEKVKAFEATDKKNLLTPEGNEMAYDLETLLPVKELAATSATKEDCEKAKHEHGLNYPVVEDEQSAAIEKMIRQICP